MITYGHVSALKNGALKMNGLLCFVLLGVTAALGSNAADMDMYQDLPEDYFVDQVVQRMRTREAEPLFSYQFPPPGVEHDVSQFAFRPPDARFYQNQERDTGIPDREERFDMLQQPSDGETSAIDDDTFNPAPLNVKHSSVHDVLARQGERETPLDVRERGSEGANDVLTRMDEKEQPMDVREGGSETADGPQHEQVVQTPFHMTVESSDVYFIAIVAGCSAAALVGVILIGISWYRLQRNAKAAADVEYPAYGVTGPNKETSPTGDRKLAQSAQMYHYQHQKQQIIAMENRATAQRHDGSMSEAESEEENEEGDYTVYECPGLAPTGEMEVKNPLFLDDATPATPATVNSKQESANSPKQADKK